MSGAVLHWRTGLHYLAGFFLFSFSIRRWVDGWMDGWMDEMKRSGAVTFFVGFVMDEWMDE